MGHDNDNDNDNGITKRPKHTARQGVDNLPGQMDLLEHAREGAPPAKPFEDLGPNVVVAGMVTSQDIPVARILQGAHEADLECVLVLGYKKDGSEYFAASVADGAENVWMMERAKLRLLRIHDDIDPTLI